MRFLSKLVLASACLLGSMAATAADASDLTGHYYLSGMTEVGSELLLKKSGEFEWVLMYGATDMAAQGTWKRDGQRIVLTPHTPRPGKFRLFTESELSIKKDPRQGIWVAIVGVPSTGPVGGIEVQFESVSGRKASAVSGPNGDAIAQMPGTETWKRAGLRRAGSKDAWTWFEVPAERARKRIAGFVVLNPGELQPAPFKTLSLSSSTGQLSVDDNPMGLRGTYAKGSATD
jgi:hypothetical protein